MKSIDPNKTLLTYEEVFGGGNITPPEIEEGFMQWAVETLPRRYCDTTDKFILNNPISPNSVKADPVKPDTYVGVDATKRLGQLGQFMPNPATSKVGKSPLVPSSDLKAWRYNKRSMTIYHEEYDDWYYGITDEEMANYGSKFTIDLCNYISNSVPLQCSLTDMKISYHAYIAIHDVGIQCTDGTLSEINLGQAPSQTVGVPIAVSGPWYLGADNSTPEEVLAEEYPLDEPTAIEGPLNGGKWVISFGDQVTVEVTAEEVCEAGGSAVDAARKKLEGKSREQSLPEDDAS